MRKNHFTGLQHRHDPTIAAWDLGEGLADAAPRGGDALQVTHPLRTLCVLCRARRACCPCRHLRAVTFRLCGTLPPQAWIPYVALHLRRTDPNHLIMCSGGGGLFGPASPHHVHLNPALQVLERLGRADGTHTPCAHQSAPTWRAQMRMPWVLPPGDANSSGPRGQPSQRAAAACEGVDFVRNSMLQEVRRRRAACRHRTAGRRA